MQFSGTHSSLSVPVDVRTEAELDRWADPLDTIAKDTGEGHHCAARHEQIDWQCETNANHAIEGTQSG